MAVTALNVTSATAYFDSIEAALQAAGLLTSTLYQDATNLILNTQRFPRPLKFFSTNSLHVGDSYASGANLNNPLSLNTAVTGLSSAQMILTPDVLAFIVRLTTGPTVTVNIFGTLEDGTPVAIGFCFGDASMASAGYIVSNGGLLAIFPIHALVGILNDGASYIQHSIHVAEFGSKKYRGKIKGVKFVGKTSDVTTTHVAKGNHILTAGGNSSELLVGGTGFLHGSILIENGAI